MHVLVLKALPSLEIEVWNQIGSCSASSESGIFESDDEEEDNGLFQASQGSCHHDFLRRRQVSIIQAYQFQEVP